MKLKLALTLISGMLVLALTAVSQTPSASKHHVVFEMTAPEGPEWNTLFVHVNNLRTALEPDGGVEVEIVFFAEGLNMLRKTNTAYEARLKQLADSGVKLAACQNAMRFMKITTEDLFPFASQVDSGIAELVRKQEAGWAYIK